MLSILFDWAESWAPLIPLAVLLWYPSQPAYLKPVIIYLWISIILNTAANIIWKQEVLGLALFTDNNTPIYNIHSIIRFSLFATFFISLKHNFAKKTKLLIPIVYGVILLVSLLNWESMQQRFIDYRAHAAEAALLIIYCLLFYFHLLQNAYERVTKLPSFWIVTGLMIFCCISLPIYLYYGNILKDFVSFAVKIWIIQKSAFVVLCMSVAFSLSLTRIPKPLTHG